MTKSRPSLLVVDDAAYNIDLLLPSSREREVLQMLAVGKQCSKIADSLCLAPSTVETYRYRLMQKLGIPDLPGLIKLRTD